MPREFPEDPVQDKPLRAGLAFCGEYLVPGGSHLVQGDMKGAATHGVLGFAAGMLFGFPARLLVSANSLRTASVRGTIEPKMEAEDMQTLEATETAAVEAAETMAVETTDSPAVEPLDEIADPAADVTKPPSPVARRSPSPRKTVVKRKGKASTPKSVKKTASKKASARSPRSKS